MTSGHTPSQKGKTIVGMTIAGLALITLFCNLDGAAGCHLLGKTAWAALEVLRLAVMLARWHTLAAYLYENSWFVHHVLPAGACAWPLLSAVAGLSG